MCLNPCYQLNKDRDEAIVAETDTGIPFLIYPYLTNGFSHQYQLGESTFISRGVRSEFCFLSNFSMNFRQNKQNSPRWAAAFCAVTSWAILFASGTVKTPVKRYRHTGVR